MFLQLRIVVLILGTWKISHNANNTATAVFFVFHLLARLTSQPPNELPKRANDVAPNSRLQRPHTFPLDKGVRSWPFAYV